jgi:hypothetical protein
LVATEDLSLRTPHHPEGIANETPVETIICYYGLTSQSSSANISIPASSYKCLVGGVAVSVNNLN